MGRSTVAPSAGPGTLACLVAGGVLWTATEYSVHRWVMHGQGGKNPLSEEHLDHHANPDRTNPLALDAETLGWKGAGFALVAALTAPFAGARRAFRIATGYTAGYCGYTWLHDRMHHRPPSGPVTRVLWRNHFRHHFSTPRKNFGVTSPIWDVVGGSTEGSGPVKVPRRLAMSWLTGSDGEIRADFADDYALAGSTRRRHSADDLRRALADKAPVAD